MILPEALKTSSFSTRSFMEATYTLSEPRRTAFLAERFLPVNGRPLCIVPDTRLAFAHLCQALVGNPAAREPGPSVAKHRDSRSLVELPTNGALNRIADLMRLAAQLQSTS